MTLSLPSVDYKCGLNVVFVLDGSTSSDAHDLASSASDLLNKLAEFQNTDVKAGLVIFGGSTPILYSSEDLLSLTEDNLNTLTEVITDKSYDGMSGRSGSNLQAGVEAAQEMLDGESAVEDVDKYMILLTDGGARMWLNDSGEAMSQTFVQYNASNLSWGSNQDFASRYIEESEKKPLRTFDEVWQAGNSDSAFTKYAMSYAETQQDGAIARAASWNTVCRDEDGTYYPSLEVATYYAATSIIEAAESCNVIWVDYPYHSGAYEEYTDSFKSWMAEENYVTRYDSQDKDAEEVFSDVDDQLTYLIGAGSYVIDYMGYVANDYNFDFVNDSSKIYVTVDDEKLEAVQLSENKYGFGNAESGYDYVLTYTPADDGQESFRWDICVPVTNLRHVQLHYTVKLMNPKTQAGTYGIYDGDGSKEYTGLYTNVRATLYPVISTGNTGIYIKNNAPYKMPTNGEPIVQGQDFLKPTVSYEVNSVSPQTGDSSMFLWFALLLISSVTITLIAIAGRKKKYNK